MILCTFGGGNMDDKRLKEIEKTHKRLLNDIESWMEPCEWMKAHTEFIEALKACRGEHNEALIEQSKLTERNTKERCKRAGWAWVQNNTCICIAHYHRPSFEQAIEEA